MINKKLPGDRRTTIKIVIVLIVIAILFRIVLLLADSFPFNSDEAVVGLMAKHILDGDRPIYFYGQAYMGSLDAYLIAAGFHFFGTEVWVIRLVQLILYIALLCSTALLTYMLFGSRQGTISTIALLLFPTINFTLYTSVSLGGYAEALLIGNIILIIGVKLIFNDHVSHQNLDVSRYHLYTGILGFLTGLGFWVNGLTIVYSIPVVLLLIYKSVNTHQASIYKKLSNLIITVIFLLLGEAIGSIPIGLYAFDQGIGVLIREFFGGAVAIEKGSIFIRSLDHLSSFIIFAIPVILGFRPPWEIRWMILPIMPFVLAFWIAVVGFWIRQLLNRFGSRLSYATLVSVLVLLIFGFVFTSFGIDPSGRYFLPFTIILAMIGGQFVTIIIRKKIFQIFLIGIVGLYNLLGVIDCALRNPPGLTTQFDQTTIIDNSKMGELIEFLEGAGEHYGYTNYWVAYPLAFQSEESMIYIPALPYHQDLRYSARDDRYPRYQKIVGDANRTAYISTRNPKLDLYLESLFRERGVTYKTKKIGDFLIYYDLSARVEPNEKAFN